MATTERDAAVEHVWADEVALEQGLALRIEVGQICGESFVALADLETSTGKSFDPIVIDGNHIHQVIEQLAKIEEYLAVPAK